MKFEERALHFPCHGSWLYGILSVPEQPFSRGVLVIVGGPQYRAGSHRQFTLLARHLAAHGVAVMRFDYRGMGDSEGSARSFEDIGEDIHAAIEHFFSEIPSLKELVIWGLCDGASAALFHAHGDRRVTGLVLLNPWVRTENGAAKTYLKHYYLSRLLSADLWRKIRGGRFDYGATARSAMTMVRSALSSRSAAQPGQQAAPQDAGRSASLPERMLDGFKRFRGKTLLILSGNDLTAKEFTDLVSGSRQWRALLKSSRVQLRKLPDANHTFSRQDWRDQVASWTSEWTRSW